MTLNSDAHTQSSRTSKPKLDDGETIILMAGANRKDGIALPVPDSIAAPPVQVARKIKRLIKLALLEEVPAKLEDDLWRKTEDDRHLTLKITPLAFEVLGLDAPVAANSTSDQTANETDAAAVSAGSSEKAKSPAPKKGAREKPPNASRDPGKPSKGKKISKNEILLTLLERPKGASLDELIKASGWQAHSVRGFLSAVVKKKLRLKLTSEEDDKGLRRYRIKPRAKA